MKRALGFFLAVVLSFNVWPATVAFATDVSEVQTEESVENTDFNEVPDQTDENLVEETQDKEEVTSENAEATGAEATKAEAAEADAPEDLSLQENVEETNNKEDGASETPKEPAIETAEQEEQEEQGFVVTFSGFTGGKYIAYDRQNVDEAVVFDNADSAIARDSDTGEIDTTGSGQVNFSVVMDDGYSLESIEITEGTENYKNLKTISEEGNVHSYRITKITGNLTVTVNAKKLDTEGARAKLIEEMEAVIDSCPKYFEIYCTEETASVLKGLLDTVKEFDYETVSDEEVKAVTESIKEAVSNLVYKTAEVPQVYISTENGNGNSLEKKTGYINTDITIVDSDGNVISQDGSIKVRGNSTANAEKKAYNIKFSSKQDVFGMGKAKKWCLLANCYDASLLRNATAFEIAHELGIPYTSEVQFVELWMDGIFKGCFLLTEAVEAGATRVDIDVKSQEFMIELERNRTESDTTYVTNANGLRFAIKEPEEPSSEQLSFIQNTLDRVTSAIDSGDYAAVSEVIDVETFAKYYLLNEYMTNYDFDHSSVYFFYKDGKLYAGPAWDYDLSSGNAQDGADNLRVYNYSPTPKCNWYPYLMKYSEFQKVVEDVFAQYSDFFDSIASDGGFIDTTYATYKNVFDRNFNEAGWVVSKKYSTHQMTPFATLDENIAYFKEFLSKRSSWMNRYYRNLVPNVWVYPVENINDGITITWREEPGVDSYRVYRCENNNWAPVSGFIQGGTFTDYTVTENVDYKYDVIAIVGDSKGSLYGKGVSARLDSKQEVEFSVNKLPSDVFVSRVNEKVAFDVAASGKNVKYMWYVKTPNSDRFIKTGVDTTEYSRKMTVNTDGMLVYCVISDAYGHKFTTDTVGAYITKEFKILRDTEDKVVYKSGGNVTFSIDVQGNGISYSWYCKKTEQAGGDGKFHKAGCYSNEYTVRASSKTDGMEVYCKLTDQDGKKLNGRVATLSIVQEETVISYPNGKEIEAVAGKKASFKVEVQKEDVTYSWYVMRPVEAGGDGKFHKAGCYTNEYIRSASKNTDGLQAYCKITDANGKITNSDIIVLRVK